MFHPKLLAVACLTAIATHAYAATGTVTHDRLEQLAREMTQTTASLYPITATRLGITGHDGELETPSEAYRQHYIAQLNIWKKRLHAIAADGSLSLVDRDDVKLLQSQIARHLNLLKVYKLDRKDYGTWALNVVGVIYDQFLHLPLDGVEGAQQSDVKQAWGDIIRRMDKAPAYISAGQRLSTTPGRLYGTISRQQLADAPEFFNDALTAAARNQLGEQTAEFKHFVQARDRLLQTVAATRYHIDANLARWPENHVMSRKSYDAMLRDEQLLPFTSDDIQRMGRDELAHGWAEEGWLRARSIKLGQPFGPESGGGIAPGGAALIDYYRNRIADLRNFMVDNDVVTVPAWLGTMKIVETPPFLQSVSPGASMISPRLFAASTTGFYFITPPKSLTEAAARLDMNQDFDSDRIMSTGAHEAMPGHFMQLSIAKRHSNYIRRIEDSGEFAEGWAFYGEEMFVRMGMYGDHLDGRLFTARWERVRGARAIVDFKFITGAWGFEQAAEFYSKQSGFTLEAAKAAVAGIAKSPGYMISYTVGRVQLQTLLGEYLRRTGDKGSLHDFHDRLLSYGTTPFSIVGPELLEDLNKPVEAVRAAANY